MNALFAEFGLSSWKALLTAFALPPTPLLLVLLVGARLLPSRRALGWLLVWLATAALWLGACAGVGDWLIRAVLRAPPPLDAQAQAALRRDAAQRPTAVIVLGAGRETRAPEYGMSNLKPMSVERLRYGVWLGRELGVPVGFTGGTGYAQPEGPSEAEIAARIAAHEFGRPLRWVETASRDTRENAAHSVALLKGDGIARIVIVTHAWHMPRAERAFRDAARRAGVEAAVIAAPMAWAPVTEHRLLRWLPTVEGFALVRYTLREGLGLLMGA